MVVERVAAKAPVCLGLRACLCIGAGQVHDSIIEQLVNEIAQPRVKTALAPPMRQTSDAVERLPDRHRRKAQALVWDRIEEAGRLRFGRLASSWKPRSCPRATRAELSSLARAGQWQRSDSKSQLGGRSTPRSSPECRALAAYGFGGTRPSCSVRGPVGGPPLRSTCRSAGLRVRTKTCPWNQSCERRCLHSRQELPFARAPLQRPASNQVVPSSAAEQGQVQTGNACRPFRPSSLPVP